MLLPINIAIDGPAGAGKSTVARKVAEKLGERYTYVDTGALYRGITYMSIRMNKDIHNEDEVLSVFHSMQMEFDNSQQLIINGKVINDEIRTPEVSRSVSIVASFPSVRRELLKFLRKLAEKGGVVMDGRDIGEFVLPNADVKIFLTASIDVRANRRAIELQEKNYEVNIETLKGEIALRDKRDSEREESPLVQAKDAILIDTTELSIVEVIDKIVKICNDTIRRKEFVD